MELIYHVPAGADFVETAVDILSSTRDLVGTDASASGAVRDGVPVVVLTVPDGSDRDAVRRVVKDATGLDAEP